MSSYKRGGPSNRGGGSRGNTRFTGKKRSGQSFRKNGGGGVAYGIDRPAPIREDDGSASAERFEEVRTWDEIDSSLGFERFESGSYEGESRKGWLVNMHQVRTLSWDLSRLRMCVDDRRYKILVQWRVVWRPWIITSSKMTEECSKRRYRTNRTFI